MAIEIVDLPIHSMAIFHSYVNVYQRVYPINIPMNHYKMPLNHYKSHDFPSWLGRMFGIPVMFGRPSSHHIWAISMPLILVWRTSPVFPKTWSGAGYGRSKWILSYFWHIYDLFMTYLWHFWWNILVLLAEAIYGVTDDEWMISVFWARSFGCGGSRIAMKSHEIRWKSHEFDH